MAAAFSLLKPDPVLEASQAQSGFLQHPEVTRLRVRRRFMIKHGQLQV
jgi:hypothetical protein